MQTVVLNGLYFPFVDLLSTVALAVVLGYGGHLYFGGSITLGTLFAFMLYVQNFFDPVQQLSQLYNTFLSATAALDKIMDVLDEEPEVRDRPGARELAQIEGRVALRGRALRVRPRRRGAARDRPRRARPGRPSRSSATPAPASRRSRSCSRASTTRPHGRITIDGVDLRDVTQASLRRQLGVVPQEGFLFAGTVRENIAFGRPDAAADEIVARSADGRRARLHPAARGRLRDAARRARHAPLARPAAARRVRARAARRPAHPDPRRGDVVGRHRHRAEDRAGAARAARRPHRVHHRAPPLDDPRRRPDRRARARPRRRAGHRTTSCSRGAGSTRRSTATGPRKSREDRRGLRRRVAHLQAAAPALDRRRGAHLRASSRSRMRSRRARTHS